jgi:hypothetical protein
MKELKMQIKNCNDCPFFRHEKWLYSYICDKHKMTLMFEDRVNNGELREIPDFCELPDLKTT